MVIDHIPMVHERFSDLNIFHERFLSTRAKGGHSSAVCAYWAGLNGNILATNNQVRVGVIQYFLKHTLSVPTSSTQFKRITHVFARIHWYKTHLREKWYGYVWSINIPSSIQNFGPMCNNFKDCCAI